MRLFAEHISKVLNNHKKTDDNFITDIIFREVMAELDKIPMWAKFIIDVSKLTNDKSPGISNVHPKYFKTISEANLLHHFNFIVEFWEDRQDYMELGGPDRIM